MWRELLRGSEWSELFDLASPAFFEVLTAGDLRERIQRLTADYLSRSRFEQAQGPLAASLERAQLPVRLASTLGPAHVNPPATAMDRRQQGSALLQLFFHQLLRHRSALLDLRSTRFSVCDDRLDWSPRPLTVRWDDAFLDALRDLYAGHYRGDESTFSGALRALGIVCAQDIFLQRFPRDLQRNVAFRLRDFRRAFHDIFVRCRNAHVRLHGDFLPLGIYLACLYEHLEQLGGGFDVTAAFLAVEGGNDASRPSGRDGRTIQ